MTEPEKPPATEQEKPPRVFVVWLTAGALGAGALLALLLAHG